MPLTDETSKIAYSGSVGSTNNTTAVTVVPNPGTGGPNIIIDKDCFSVLNRDSVDATVIVTVAGAAVIIERVTLSPGFKWTNPSRVVIQPGQSLTLELLASITTNQLTWQVGSFFVVD
ncbi:MAG: hypothetical protein WC761_01785 [Candidatus Paceibacterota bacterium]|jgi:hypothetical protein